MGAIQVNSEREWLRLGSARLIWRGLVALAALCFAAHSSANTTCSTVPVVSYTGAASINWSGSMAAGTVIGTGTLTVSQTCSGVNAGGGGYVQVGFGGLDYTSNTPTGVAGVYMQMTGSPSYSMTAGCQTVNEQSGTGYIAWNFKSTTAGSCTYTVQHPIKFFLAGGGMGNGNLWNTGANPLAFNTDWQTGSGTNGQHFTATVSLSSVLSPMQVNGINTCTVSAGSTSISVVLPTVSKTALSAAGQSAGRTPFFVTLTGCTYSGTNYVATATWSFTPGASASLLSNTAGSPASNVYAQLLDSNFSAISNGGTTSLNITAAGTISKTYYAQYYAAAAAGAGAVQGSATFTMTYL